MSTRYSIVDSAEQPNPGAATLPEHSTRYRRPDPPVSPVLVAGLLVIGLAAFCGLGAFLMPLWERWRRWVEVTDLLDLLFSVAALAAGALIVGAVWAALSWLRVLVLRSAIVRMQNDHPISVQDAPQVARGWRWALEEHYRVQATWAAQSGLRGLGAFSPSYHNRQDVTGSEQPPALPAPTIPALDAGRGLFDQLPITPGRLFIGYGASGEPIHTRTNAAGLLAIAGRSGSGKTTTARLLVAQHALHGGGLVLIDGHGGAGAESLAQSCEPLRGAFLIDPAIDDDSIWRLVQAVDDLARRRLSGDDPDRTPILLVIDEFTGLAIRHPQAEQIVKVLVAFGNEYRKVAVAALLIGQHWKAGIISDRYGTALRSAIGARLIHRTDADNARYLLRHDELADVDRLPTGAAILFDGDQPARRAAVPFVRAHDLVALAPRLAVRAWPDLRSDLIADTDSPLPRTAQNADQDRDLLVKMLFAEGLPVRDVAARVRSAGYELDNNVLPELRAQALGEAPATRPDGLEAVQNASADQQITRPCPKCGRLLDMARYAAAKRRGHCAGCKDQQFLQ